jgi:hypothetical protein
MKKIRVLLTVASQCLVETAQQVLVSIIPSWKGTTTSISNVVGRQAGDTITGTSISVMVWQGVD